MQYIETLKPNRLVLITNLMLSIGALYGSFQSVTIPETANIQFVLLKMSTAMLETC
jgi:hypothetical protein